MRSLKRGRIRPLFDRTDRRDVSEDSRLFDEGQSRLLIGEAAISGTARFLRQEVSICCHFDFTYEFLLTERPACVSALANPAGERRSRFPQHNWSTFALSIGG